MLCGNTVNKANWIESDSLWETIKKIHQAFQTRDHWLVGPPLLISALNLVFQGPAAYSYADDGWYYAGVVCAVISK